MSLFRLSDDPDEELQIIEESNAQWDRARRRVSQWDDATVQNVGRWAGAAPMVEPRAAFALAESGVDPYSDVGREVVAAAGEDYYQGWRQGQEPGEFQVRGFRGFGSAMRRHAQSHSDPEVRANFDPIVDQALEPTALELVLQGEVTAQELLDAEGAGTWEEYAEAHNLAMQIRGALAEDFGEEWVNEKRGVQPQAVAEQPEGISDEDWSKIQIYLAGGPDPEDLSPEADRYLTFEATQERNPVPPTAWTEAIEQGNFDAAAYSPEAVDEHLASVNRPNGENVISRTVNPIVRSTFMALNAPVQELVGAFRQTVSTIRENGLSGVTRPLSSPEQAFAQTGSGFGVPAFQQTAENISEDGIALLDQPLDGFSQSVARTGSGFGNQSDLGIAVEQALTGEEVDTGSGFFVDPRSGVAMERLSRERSYGTVNGQALTMGRWFADTFTGLEHGDRGFGALSGLVDFGVVAFGDPLNFAGDALMAARRGRAMFSGPGSLGAVADDAAAAAVSRFDLAQQASARGATRIDVEEAVGGLPRALVPDLDPTTTSGWLLAGEGRRVAEAIAAEPSVANLMRNTKWKLRPEAYPALADASTVDEVIPILFDELKLHGDRSFRLNQPVLQQLERGTWSRRSMSMAPVQQIHMGNAREFTRGLYDYMVNARVPMETIDARMREAALSPQAGNRTAVLERALDDVMDTLVDEFGIDTASARALTSHITGDATMDRVFAAFNGEHASGLPDMMVPDGAGGFRAEPRAQLWSEFAPDVVKLPNTREIKRLTGAMAPFGKLLMEPSMRLNGKGELVKMAGEWSNAGQLLRAADFITTKVWKPSVLLRPAYAIRQGIDENLRMAAAGVPSLFNHPMHYLFSAIFDAKADERFLRLLAEPNGGFKMMPEFQQAMMSGNHLSVDDMRRIATDMWLKGIDSSDPRFVGAWGRELGQLAADPVATKLAQGVPIDQVVDDLLNGDLVYVREGMKDIHPNSLGGDAAGVREYVEFTWKRIQHQTGNSDTLRQAIADGFLRGGEERLFFSEPGMMTPTKGFEDLLADFVDEFAPQKVKVEKTLEADKAHRAVETANRYVGNAFNFLATRPLNMLTKAPPFRYFYFDSLAERMPFFTREAQDAIIEMAGKYKVAGFRWDIGDRTFGVGDDLLTRLEDARASGRTGDLGIAEAENYGRFQAMQKVEHLVGDFTRRGQTLDAMRVITPFGNAWREALSAYGRLIKTNPLVIRRPGQAINGAMESGFFYEDANGEWVFSYPGSAWLLQKLGAAPFPLTGRARGLTMGFEITPGFGPLVTVPAYGFIPDTPRFENLREILVPYGAEGDIRMVVPEWLEKVMTASANVEFDGWAGDGAENILNTVGRWFGGNSPDSVQQWNASIIDTATYLISTGEYDMSTAAGRERLFDEARRMAAPLWLWRGLAQSTVPSAPRPNPVFEVGDSETMLVWPMLERLHELREQDPLNANQRFLAEFGDLAFGLLSGKTESSALYTAYDSEGFDWVREHDRLMETYPDIAALFAPTGGGPAGIGGYLRRIENGELESVDHEEWFDRAQEALASVQMNQARERVAAAMEQAGYAPNAAVPEPLQDWLSAERQRLIETYPGFAQRRLEAPELDRTIADLEEAMAQEDEFRTSDAGIAAAEYLRLRDRALEAIDAATTADSLASTSAAGLRAFLYAEGERLVMEHPDFANMWDRVFVREVELAEEG